jgi:amino acid transporter/mannitol/fructose-specific phosphotransferase system IIA component (Ntr-type)/nucleotide-binding universal stress UspA family protein
LAAGEVLSNTTRGRRVAKQLDRKLGYWSVVSISVGAMLGSGIFVLPGLAAAIAGPWVGLSYLLAGICILPAVASKAELATAMPVAGGTYVYVDRAMGPWIGTIVGIGTWLSLSAKTAFALVGLGAYLIVVGGEGASSLVKPISLGILGILTVVNIVGVGKASTLQTIIVTICVLALTVFGILGSATADPDTFSAGLGGGFSGIVAGAAFVFVSYAGVTKVCSIAEEVHHPSRNLPRGMFTAHFTVMFIYGVIASLVIANSPAPILDEVTGALVNPMHLSRTPMALAAYEIAGQVGMVSMAIISILGLISMSNAGILSASRYPFAMSRDDLLPETLQHLSPRFNTPVPAILATAALLFALVWFLPVVKLAKLASAFKIIVFCLVNVAVIVLRESHARWYRPTYKSPLYPWIQILGCITYIGLLTTMSLFAVSGVAFTILLGTLWYFIYVRKRVGRRSALAHLWGEARLIRETRRAEHEEEQDYQPPRVITPLFGNETNSRRLMRLGATFVDGGWLEVLRLEELPEQTMLTGMLEEDEEMRRLEEESANLGDQQHVRVAFHDILTHNAKRAVQEHAEKTRAEWIVMNWPEQHGLAALVRNPMAWWLDHTPCDLALLRDRGEAQWLRVLILAKPGPYDSLVMHVGDRIVHPDAGSLTLCMPLSEGCSEQDRSDSQAYFEQLAELCVSKTERLELTTDDLSGSIAELSADYDLLLLGAQPESPLRTLLFGSWEHRLADAAQCSVLMVKAPQHTVHTRFVPPVDSTLVSDNLQPSITTAAVGLRLRATRKEDLLMMMASRLAHATGIELPAELAVKLRERERQQSTQLPGGVALIGITKGGIPTSTLGLFTVDKPLAWGGASNDPVDLCLVVLSPPGERQVQLWMLGRLARIIPQSGFLDRLRGATTEELLLQVLRDADEHLDDYLKGSEESGDQSIS